MEIKHGTQIRYSCAAGVRRATVAGIKIAPTAKPGHSIPWLKLIVAPVLDFRGAIDQRGYTATIPADDASLKMFKVQVLG